MAQRDTHKSNNTQLEMAIVDLFHCENIPDNVVQSQRFKIVLKKAKLVSNDFAPSNRMKIGRQLLDLNYKNCYDANKKTIQKEASLFGLAWMWRRCVGCHSSTDW